MGRHRALLTDPDWYTYNVGNFRITLGRPRIAHASPPGEISWFAGIHRFPDSGDILLRMSATVDSDQVAGLTRNIISTDGGQTFDPATLYDCDGNPSPQEPMVMESNGTLHGGEFVRWSRPGGDLRSVQCGYTTITNGGRTYAYTPLGVTITGFPRDIGTFGSATVVGISWTDRVIKISDAQWISTIQPKYVGDTQIHTECIESTDQGHTWTVVGHVAFDIWDEGFSECSTIRLTNGTLVCVARTGVTPCGRASSTDTGRTWTVENHHQQPLAAHGINAWCKSPCLTALSSGDFSLTMGYMNEDSSEPNVRGLAPAQMGLYVSSDVFANGWAVVDLVAHHNRMRPASEHFSPVNPSTGYTKHIEMPGGTANSANLLINYDQSIGAYGTATRVLVVNAHVVRLS